jgi:hypothetical protein
MTCVPNLVVAPIRLAASGLGSVPVMLGVQFGGFRSVMRRVVHVSVRGVRVVRSAFVISSFKMLCRLAMVPSRVLVVIGRFPVVFRCLFGHKSSSCICDSRTWGWQRGPRSALRQLSDFTAGDLLK